MLEKLDKEMILQSIERTKEKVDFILLDWKGLGTEKQRIVELLKNMNLEMGRSDHTLKN
jgi:D-tyrosyl-tRNA(Tyr) deacylase